MVPRPGGVRQAGDPYRIARSRGPVWWDVLWVGPLSRYFTRLRVPAGNGCSFLVVDERLPLIPADSAHPQRCHDARCSGYRLFGTPPASGDARIKLLRALASHHVALVARDRSAVWSLAYDVRFEPDHFDACVRVLDSLVSSARMAYR